jgi:hypothetical protein
VDATVRPVPQPGTACHGRVILPSFHYGMTASARPLSAATCTPIARRGVLAGVKLRLTENNGWVSCLCDSYATKLRLNQLKVINR